MTEERAKELGIFTAWSVVSCQCCGDYTEIRNLVEANGGVICNKCKRLADKLADQKAQRELFAEAPTLF